MAASRPRDTTAIEHLAAWSLADHKAFHAPLVRRQARLLILDSIGCAYNALSDAAMDPVLAHCAEMGGRPEATVIGGEKTSVLNATFANGALVRGLDLNDVMFEVKDGQLAVSGHRSDNIPVALAVGERIGSSIGAVIDAIALNYELYGRFRFLMRQRSPWDGASASAMVAAAMAGRLMGLDSRRQANAIGLAATRTATPKIVRKGEISAAKNLANAFVAQAGVQTALLAAKGVTGPLQALDHEDGLHQIFHPDLGLHHLWAPVEEPAEILRSHVKSYPSIGTSQTAVTAALRMHDRLRNRLADIDAIKITMADVPAVRHQQADQARANPRSREAADHSFSFCVVIALLDGRLTTHQFTGERWLKPDVIALMNRVTLSVAADLRDRVSGSMPARVHIKLRDGTELMEECLYPPGHSFAEKGLDPKVVIDKFNIVSAPPLAARQQSAIAAAALDKPEKTSIAELMRLVAG